MEKWKKNKQNLSEEKITCLIFAGPVHTHIHNKTSVSINIRNS